MPATLFSYAKNLFFPPKPTDNPKKWPRSLKNRVIFIIAYAGFVAPLGSSIYFPAVLDVMKDLDTTASVVSTTLSVYILTMGVVPVFWASLCDFFGRRPIYLSSMTIFAIASIGAALSTNVWMFLVMRILQGFGASSVLSVGGGSLSDVFESHERGTAFGLYYLGPLVGPILGPVIGGVMSQALGWRSTMWLLFGAGVLAVLLVLFLLPETFREQEFDQLDEQQVQGQQVAEMVEGSTTLTPGGNIFQTTHSDPTLVAANLGGSSTEEQENEKKQNCTIQVSTVAPSTSSTLSTPTPTTTPTSVPSVPTKKPRKSFNPLRPLICMRNPSNVLLICYSSTAIGSMFTLQNTLPHSFFDVYGFSDAITGLCFLSLGFGNVIGSIVGGRYSDYVLKKWMIKQQLKKQKLLYEKQQVLRHKDLSEVVTTIDDGDDDDKAMDFKKIVAPPEIRIQSVWIGVAISPIALIAYGLSIQYATTVAIPLISIFFFGFGSMMVYSSTTTVLVDSNSEGGKAAFAVSCNSFVRGIVGAIAGVIALPMKNSMGTFWQYFFWACICLIGAVPLLYMVRKGKVARMRKEKEEARDQV